MHEDDNDTFAGHAYTNSPLQNAYEGYYTAAHILYLTGTDKVQFF